MRLLRLLPNAACALQLGRVDPPETTYIYLAAVAERTEPLQGTAPTWRSQVERRGRGRFTDRILAYVQSSCGSPGPAEPLFRLDRPPASGRIFESLTRSNRRGTDPYARWCGRGGAARLPPIPISGRRPGRRVDPFCLKNATKRNSNKCQGRDYIGLRRVYPRLRRAKEVFPPKSAALFSQLRNLRL